MHSAERRHLIERLAGELPKLVPADARKPAAEADDPELLGFLAEDPALADEICRIATVEREGNDLRDGLGLENWREPSISS